MGCVQDREEQTDEDAESNPQSKIDIQSEIGTHADALIPYEEDDPVHVKITKIKDRWKMTARNMVSYMKDLKFCFMICQSIESCLPNDDYFVYNNVNQVMKTLHDNNIAQSCFCSCMSVYSPFYTYFQTSPNISKHFPSITSPFNVLLLITNRLETRKAYIIRSGNRASYPICI